MPICSSAARGRARRQAGALLAALAALAGPVAAGEVPAVSLAQEDAAGAAALPRLDATGAPEPLITFEIAVGASCPQGRSRPELLVAIADATRILVLQRPREALSLPVPLGQLRWLASPAEICASLGGKRTPDRTEDTGLHLFRLHAVTAAFATVFCPEDDGRSASASSALPLDAWLACPAP